MKRPPLPSGRHAPDAIHPDVVAAQQISGCNTSGWKVVAAGCKLAAAGWNGGAAECKLVAVEWNSILLVF